MTQSRLVQYGDTNMTTLQALQELIDSRFHGKLSCGKHKDNEKCCALELLSVYHELPWTDNPTSVRCLDLRLLNDIPVSDELRTVHLLPVLAAYDGSLDWPRERQLEVATRIVVGLVRDVISQLPCLPDATRNQCLCVKTLDDAYTAANAANATAYAAAADAAYAAANAAYAAAYAASAAAYAAANAAKAANAASVAAIFTTSCRVFLEAAN